MERGVIIIGKIPPPYFGPAVATKIILESNLKEDFDLTHLDTRINKGIDTMGKFQLKKMFALVAIYLRYIKLISRSKNRIVLLPIAQESLGLYKDLVFLLLALLFRKKVVLHLRGSSLLNWYQKTSKWNQRIFKFAFSKATAAIVLGEKLRYLFEPFLTADKIYVVSNGTDFVFPEKVKQDKIQILYFANLMYNKGLDLLLLAIKNLNIETRNKINCIVVGKWENQEFQYDCETLISDHQLPVEVFPPKSGNDKLSYFANADLFVFTPRAPEGHPWVIVEAMAAGLPIISTDQGAIVESVIDGKNGFIIDPNESKTMSSKLLYLIENTAQLKTMGNESKKLYLEKFTEEKMVFKLKELFLNLLK